MEQPQTSKVTSATLNTSHVKITIEMWACHTVSQSSNKVEHSTMSTDAGLVHVVSLYLPESRENSTRMEKKRGGKKRHIGTMVSLLKKKKNRSMADFGRCMECWCSEPQSFQLRFYFGLDHCQTGNKVSLVFIIWIFSLRPFSCLPDSLLRPLGKRSRNGIWWLRR